MDSAQILELASRYESWEADYGFTKHDLIAFAQSILEADRAEYDKPVAWLDVSYDCKENAFSWDRTEDHDIPLYRRPARKPLTDEEILDAANSADFASMVTADDFVFVLARAIEQKIWEKNS